MPREGGLRYSDPEPQGLVLDLFCFDFLANLMVEMLALLVLCAYNAGKLFAGFISKQKKKGAVKIALLRL